MTSNGMKVKTLYCAPYLSAAKAAIAKFLRITVAEVTTSGGQYSTPIGVGSEREFDDVEDQEFASFDLDAVVSSAKKLSQQQSSSVADSSCNHQGVTSAPKLPRYPKSQLMFDSPAVQKASGQKDLNLLKVEKEGLRKDIEALKQEKDVLEKETNSTERAISKLRDQKSFILDEIDDATQTKTSLQSDITTLRQEKARLDIEADAAIKQVANLKSEAKSENLENEKLKGKVRAIREEYDQLAAEVKKIREQKIQLENEVRSVENARIEKASEPSASLKSTGIEEPAKKRKAAKKKGCAVVTSMKVADLGAEAIARGLDVKVISMMRNKNELLETLVVGSSCITKTDAWAEVLRIREKFENERRQAKEQEDRRQEALQAKREQEERERQEKLQAEEAKKRALEVASQVEKHTLHIPKVHECKLAKTNDLLFHGQPREYYTGCSNCRDTSLYTCEKCNYDICEDCYREKTMTAAEKKAEAKKAQMRWQEYRAEVLRSEKEEEEKRRKKWAPEAHFKTNIVNPPEENLNPDSTKGYIVWSRHGYECDGFQKEYDSTWSTKANANERAKYLFYWKNPWRYNPERMMEEEVVNESKIDGLVKFKVCPLDSLRWTVSVVPAVAFVHMDYDYDDDGPTASDFGYYSYF